MTTATDPCPDCGVAPGGFHARGCDIEQCPYCGRQLLACVCKPRPPLDEGPHRSYAWQWAIFSVIAVVGYPLALRRRARSAPDRVEEPGDEHAGPQAA